MSTSYDSSREELRHSAQQQAAAIVIHPHRTSTHLKFDLSFHLPTLVHPSEHLPLMQTPPPVGVAAWQQQMSQALSEQLRQNQQQAQQIAELHRQLVAMQQEMNVLHQHPAAAADIHPAASAPLDAVEHARSRNELMRVAKKPESFRGEHGTYALNWLQEMDMFLQNCEPPPSDSQKITLAKSFLRDEALRWWCAREKDVQRAAASADASLMLLTPAITTWDAFQCAVKDYFCPRGASDEARNELHRLRQTQFRNLTAYADRFETVGRRIDVPVGQSIEDELIATFKAGLMDGLIRLSLTNTKPRTLFQAIQQAHQAESDLRVAGAHGTSGRFDASRRAYGSSSNSPRQDRSLSRDSSRSYSSQFGYGGNAHAPRWKHSQGHHASGGAVPMDLSAMAAAAAAEMGSRSSDSDREPEHDREHQESPLSAEPPAGDQSLQSTPESADEYTCAPCQLNAAQEQKTSRPPRCSKCGQHMQRLPSRNPSECWNCGQPGHLSRDCPKPHRQAGSSSGNRREGGSKPRHF